MVVVDANILFPTFIDTALTERCRYLLQLDPDWRTESLAVIELSNILATYARQGLITSSRALKALESVEVEFGQGIHVVDDRIALGLALSRGLSAYDARYLTLAESLDIPLVTQDKRLRSHSDGRAESLEDAIQRLESGK